MKIKDAKPGVRVTTEFGLGTITGVTAGKYIDLVMDNPIPGRKDQSDRTWQVGPRRAQLVTSAHT